MTTPTVQLADVNVLIDAAQSIYRTWEGTTPPRGPNDLHATPAHSDHTTNKQPADSDLRNLLTEQARQGILHDQAEGKTLSDSVSTPPPPPWVRQALLAHPDGSVRELAQAAENGTLLLTTYTLSAAQAITAKRPITHSNPDTPDGHMSVQDAVTVLNALTHGRHLLSAPEDLSEVIASGKLDTVLTEVKEHAGEHLADFDPDDPYWRTPKDTYNRAHQAKPEDRTWREHKTRNPDAYGVDGDDLYILAQAREITAKTGVRVVITTSDYHLALAAARIGIPSRLYSRDRAQGVHGLDITPRNPSARKTINTNLRPAGPTPTPGQLKTRQTVQAPGR